MKIEKAQIRNFRILKEFDVDFEDDLSVVIGKNNDCGAEKNLRTRKYFAYF